MDSTTILAPNLTDVVLPQESGYPEAQRQQDTRDVLMSVCGAAARDFPSHLWLTAAERMDRCRENDENRLWAMNRIDRYQNQGPGNVPGGGQAPNTHECTGHGFVYNWTACWNKMMSIIYGDGPKDDFRYPQSGQQGSIFLSPMSLYNEANPSIWGGAGVRQILSIALRRGPLPDLIQPGGIKFKHAMPGTMGIGNINQSRGAWVPVSRMPDGWEETGELLIPDEVIFPDDWEQAACLLCHGYALTVGRDGHCVTYAMWSEQRKQAFYPDSYDVTRVDSFNRFRSCASGGYCIASIRKPADRLKPVPDHLIVA